MGETFHIEGLLRIYEIPDGLTIAEWERMSLSDKAHHATLAVEAHNLVMSAGRTQLLTFAGSNSTTPAFAQYYAVGTGTIYVVQPSDTSLATELFRAVPSSFAIVGNAVTITTTFTGSQAVATYTNSGVFGNGASSTPGSGTLMTHVLYSYTHASGVTIFNDYQISLT